MSATTVALLTTTAVAIAGFVFNYLSSSRDRRANLALARESHTHEINVRRSERSYERGQRRTGQFFNGRL